MSRRPGHTIARVNKGHPRRQARRDRAAQRALFHECGPQCKRFRTGRAEWTEKPQ